ncbi:hypothetical protein COW77_01795 [Candidatus Wolfebacteria bacterium CG18_big_fil_WC_8_21_14_2_50_39_7]|uniref:ComEC/Rec2-related protein domain-containing protein n=5 Tax=Candidatus Wolfeibacteriota TaxID=1752735 RepID=A0A2M7Q740_9BACT|nr:ComEC family competence protein [Parcubacteria group bacterium]NCO89469.1 ComEC family competence protein [Candidatus Wolfebacteria bacterium]OIO65266.1 MAG: hypothetical protein AUJ30_01310 [Candidatus Wolfebacteria bacterium CG1_02_39_135]PIP92098.1 MAG: hypothetical protein COW77_01795 [Candidatus Wolfebacteria bacterium CG18_big_fil_WC_8_21_14_2_50_39_7]PIU98971.1 MAG: hypothetical protein COS60_00220 [Candidatus Wolfebacteria bacterium CG03_land_8_20_14_0_80_39_317]PIY58932.1 MAG: hypo
MRIYDIAFYIAGFFILGVLAASSGLNFIIIIMATILMAAIFLFIGYLRKIPRIFWLTGLCLFIIIGAFYYFWWNSYQIKNLNIIFDEKINFQGLVVKNPEQGNQQKLVVTFQPPYSGKVLIKLRSYPSFDYGDLINFEGIIKRPDSQSYAAYLAKDSIFGIVDYPKTELIAKNQGSVIKSQLFKLKEKLISNFQKTLSAEKSAFLAGITLGERTEFSQEFKEAMAKSGTTHLVALSGYNITIIVLVIAAFFSRFLSRKITFVLTILAIFGFVLMTGAEASVVRAAIMGFIALLASQVSRLYSIRNAIVLAAFFMVLVNPRVLYFDVGFQLSFAALLGIVYLGPAIQKFFRIKEEGGFLGWRKNFLTTTSAQLAVAPLLIINFNQFSLTALIANILILEVIPPTMFLGFLLGAMGFFSTALAIILSWFINLFLVYELTLINVFAKISLPITKIGISGIIIYYLIMVGFIVYNYRNVKS